MMVPQPEKRPEGIDANCFRFALLNYRQLFNGWKD